MTGVLMENLGTIAVGLALIGAVSAIVAGMIRDKRQGKCIGSDCSCCRRGTGGAE